MAPSIISPQSQFLPNLALAIFAAPGLAAIATLVDPTFTHSRLYPFATPQTPQERTNVNAIWRIFASRDLFMSVAGCAVYASGKGNRRLLGVLMAMTVPCKLIDGAVAKTATGKGYWEHWTFVPVFGAIAAGLLGWLG